MLGKCRLIVVLFLFCFPLLSSAESNAPWIFFDLGKTLIDHTRDYSQMRYLPGALEYVKGLKKRGYHWGYSLTGPKMRVTATRKNFVCSRNSWNRNGWTRFLWIGICSRRFFFLPRTSIASPIDICSSRLFGQPRLIPWFTRGKIRKKSRLPSISVWPLTAFPTERAAAFRFFPPRNFPIASGSHSSILTPTPGSNSLGEKYLLCKILAI